MVKGEGSRDATVIAFPEGTRGRQVLIRQTRGREGDPACAVAEIRIE